MAAAWSSRDGGGVKTGWRPDGRKKKRIGTAGNGLCVHALGRETDIGRLGRPKGLAGERGIGGAAVPVLAVGDVAGPKESAGARGDDLG